MMDFLIHDAWAFLRFLGVYSFSKGGTELCR